MSGGDFFEAVVFERAQFEDDGFGGRVQTWVERHACRASISYHRGDEDVEHGRLRGSLIFKVRIRSCRRAREITPEDRMRDVRRGTVYNLRQVDAVSDRAHVWIIAESGVATGGTE